MSLERGRRGNVLFASFVQRRLAFLGGTFAMAQKFKVGDHVSWNSRGWPVSAAKSCACTPIDVNYKGYIHHASKEEPQYEIQSDKTAHIALQKGRPLRRLR
jgi:hypothetical protein